MEDKAVNSNLYGNVFPDPETYNGFFFSHGMLDQTPVMKLRKAAGFDELFLPVTKEALSSLVRTNYAQKSPLETKEGGVDESIRKCWELQPNQILQKNKRWAHEVNKIKPHIKEDLGLQKDKIRFTLHKILIYEPGSFHAAHNNSENEKGMIGTLIINLPSVYKGGDFILRHDGREIRHDFGGDEIRSKNTLFLAFYGDVEHEITPIEEGYRASIVYNIIYIGGNNEPEVRAPPISPEILSILEYLETWAWDLSADPILSIMANHSYSENGLRSLYKLKSSDKCALMRLKAACELFNYKYPFTGAVMVMQLLEVHKYTDKTNRSVSSDEVDCCAQILVIGPYDELDDPSYQEYLNDYNAYYILPDNDLTSGKVVRREDHGMQGDEHPMEYWYRPSVMSILLKHRIASVKGAELYQSVVEFQGKRDTTVDVQWRLYQYHILDGLCHCSPDLHYYYLALVEFTKGNSNQLEYIQELLKPLKLYVTTFSPPTLIHIAQILSWSSLLNWHYALARKSLDWATAIALTWCTLGNQLHEVSSIIPQDKEKIATAKESLLKFTVNIFMNAPPETTVYSERNPNLDPLSALMTALLCKEKPAMKEIAHDVLYRVPAVFKQICLPFLLVVHIADVFPDYNLLHLFSMFPVHSLLGEIKFAITLEPTALHRRVLREAAASYLSRGQAEYSYRPMEHSGHLKSSHEDILLCTCPFLANAADINYLMDKANLFPLTFNIYEMLLQFLEATSLQDKLRHFAEHSHATLSQVFSFIPFDIVEPSDEFTQHQREFMRALLLAVAKHSTSFRDHLNIFKVASLARSESLFNGALAFLHKVLIDSPLYGYARQDPVTFISEIQKWARNSPGFVERQIRWLGEHIVEEYEKRVRHSASSFGYEVDSYSYQTGFCPCRYCDAVIRFLQNNSIKEQRFRVSNKSVDHMISVLNNDKIIAPVVSVSHQPDTVPESELLEIIKLKPLHSRMTRSIMKQVEELRDILDIPPKDQVNSAENEIVVDTRVDSEPPMKKQKIH